MKSLLLNKTASHPLQTSYWGRFREEWGNEVLYTKYGLLTLHKIPFTNFKLGMFIRGPKPTTKMLSDLKTLAQKHKLIFIKLEPNVVLKSKVKNKKSKTQIKNVNLTKLLVKNGATRGKTLFTPTSFRIDLTKSEEELMKSFSAKTRYNIRLAQRKGVIEKEDNSNKAFDRYIELTRETVQRQGFYAHTEKYHRLMWKHLHLKPKARNHKLIAHLLTAKYQNEIITTWILFAWKDTLYYPYGASSTKHKNVMANNLMMWEAILLGKKLGLKTFDLWGREPGKGFTRFKEGYSPNVVEFLGTWDLIINKPLYYLYRLAEIARWSLLGLKSKLGFSKATF